MFAFEGCVWKLVDEKTLSEVTSVVTIDGQQYWFDEKMVFVKGWDPEKYPGDTPKKRRIAAEKEIGQLLLQCDGIEGWYDHEGDDVGADVAFRTEEGPLRALGLDGTVITGGKLSVQRGILPMGPESRIKRANVRLWFVPCSIAAVRRAVGIRNLCEPIERRPPPQPVPLTLQRDFFDPLVHPIPEIWPDRPVKVKPPHRASIPALAPFPKPDPAALEGFADYEIPPSMEEERWLRQRRTALYLAGVPESRLFWTADYDGQDLVDKYLGGGSSSHDSGAGGGDGQ